MSRDIKKDFQDLQKFISEYKLSELIVNDKFTNILSQQHKRYFAYLTLVGEIQISLNKVESNKLTTKQFNFIKESCSDFGTALFTLLHGAYKASKLLLRSSIETFLKGFNLDAIPDIDEEISVFELFTKVKSLDFYDSEPKKSLINQIHTKYKILCKDVHTTSDVNMANISSLNFFPKFLIEEANKFNATATKLIECYVTLFCLKHNDFYHQIHFKNKLIVRKSIPNDYKELVNNLNKQITRKKPSR